MKLSLSLLSLAAALLYGVIKNFAPDFPLSADVFLSLCVWALTILGVVIVEPFVRSGFKNMGFKGF